MLPSYVHLSASEWDQRIGDALSIAGDCRLCPRDCRIDRNSGTTGFCGATNTLVISSIFPHHGEEPPISGTGGSGTVFFSHCTLGCYFCQNYQISHEGEGRSYSPEELAERMLWLQGQGCHNVNFVTPTHYLPWFLQALRIAAGRGLTLPLVYNTSGYERTEPLHVLKGIVDIYLPDMKYGTDEAAKSYSCAADYAENNRAAIREMFRQVGPLRTTSDGIALRGLLIRHLVLPNRTAGSKEIADFLQKVFDPEDITIGIMAQYRPLYRASKFPAIARKISIEEYREAVDYFVDAGFNVLAQDEAGLDESFVIDFTKRKHEPLTGE